MERSDFLESVISRDYIKTRKLIEEGANINQSGVNEWTALHFAAQNNDVIIGKLLIENGASIDAQDKYGNSTLWRATFSSKGNGDFITMLLDAGANKNLNNLSGISPIELARKISNYSVIDFY